MNGSLIDESKEMEDPLREINSQLLAVLSDSNASCDKIRNAVKVFKDTYESTHKAQAAFWLLIAAGRELAHPRAYDKIAANYRAAAYACNDITPILWVYYGMFLIEQLKKREKNGIIKSPKLNDDIMRCRMHAQSLLEYILEEQSNNMEDAAR